MAITLFDYQEEALSRIKNGCILCGGVGSGKSITALAYYFIQQGGKIIGEFVPPAKKPKDLVIVTTARKRDTCEWEKDMTHFLLSPNPECNYYKNKINIISWNEIKKYKDVEGAFFIFDEQRVVGSGEWVKAFLKIARHNDWILLSATPGDTWSDYIPIFIANGFYKNKTQFNQMHVIFSPYSKKFPKIERYISEGRLIKLRENLLIDMDFKRKTIPHHEDIYTDYDPVVYKSVTKDRKNPFTNEPIINASELCYLLRQVVNSDQSRIIKIMEILEKTDRAIIFYNFNYELDILKNQYYGEDIVVAEWNGHKHQPIPTSKKWIYLVQYTAGAEGWNCISTDTIIFYSQNYSYKVMIQSSGRIDRLNTPYTDLYYYHLKSRSGIDVAISRALHSKKKFNERSYITGWG